MFIILTEEHTIPSHSRTGSHFPVKQIAKKQNKTKNKQPIKKKDTQNCWIMI
jgi:hypothetical protein